jgi:hypothetical protein
MRRIGHQEDLIMHHSSTIAAGRFQISEAAYVAALDQAHARAFHSYFTQYILADEEAGYIAVDDGDYGALPRHLMDRVIDMVPGGLDDEF